MISKVRTGDVFHPGLLINSALRISDILNLTYGDVYDYQQQEWKTHLVVTEQKTGKQNRIYMNQEIQETLRIYAQPCEKESSLWLFGSQMQKERKRQIIGVYKRSAACDIVQLEHLDNQIDAKVPSYLRF